MSADHVARAIALGATDEPVVATQAARLRQWARQPLQRLSARREPQTPQELIAYAHRIEHAMPAWAAELQYLALGRPDADD